MKTVDLKPMPSLRSDAEAEHFVETVDKYDLSRFKPVKFEFEAKSAALNMRLPQTLPDAVKVKAASEGIPYTKYMRLVLEQAVSR
ncbi:MAG: BrnA antitoxin family protein [Desulfovibrio sp.]|jgi:predicted DNA binding CopG/RHH family protein|nr:BrnA antitoxin family protein [Desulfovibrio sp.]